MVNYHLDEAQLTEAQMTHMQMTHAQLAVARMTHAQKTPDAKMRSNSRQVSPHPLPDPKKPLQHNSYSQRTQWSSYWSVRWGRRGVRATRPSSLPSEPWASPTPLPSPPVSSPFQGFSSDDPDRLGWCSGSCRPGIPTVTQHRNCRWIRINYTRP